jgi:hypothetical protein
MSACSIGTGVLDSIGTTALHLKLKLKFLGSSGNSSFHFKHVFRVSSEGLIEGNNEYTKHPQTGRLLQF